MALLFLAGVGQSFAAWDGKSMEKPETQKIDGKDFYLIASEANLAWFADSVNKNKGTISVGGIVGWQTGGSIEGCFVTGKVITSGAGNAVGGVVGTVRGGSIRNTLSTVSVYASGNSTYVGGIVGFVRGATSIEYSAYDGAALINNGDGKRGGILGFFETGTAKVETAYFDGDAASEGVGIKTDSLEVDGTTLSEEELNVGKVVCALNGGEFKDADFVNTATQITEGSTGKIKLYAKWEIKTFVVTYMGGVFALEIVEPQVKASGDTVKLKDAVFTREGYLQDGWSTEDGGKGVYRLGVDYVADADVVLYPHWRVDPDAIPTVAGLSVARFSVAAHARSLEISGVRAGSGVVVYDMRGHVVAKATASAGTFSMGMFVPGMYLVRVGSDAQRVLVR